MKVKKNPNEFASITEDYKHLIPTHAVSGEILTKISADFLRTRHETAIGMKTKNPVLAAEELARFRENCRIIGAVTLGIELRNYL